MSAQPTAHTNLPGAATGGRKFGTLAGVFTPTMLTILGAIMYLRTGWVVGNAGLLGALAIILLSNIITIATGLSISSIVTNIRVRAGGAFSIISQSLGLEVGGSVSVPFYMAQAISVAFYIFAFAEGWLRIFPNHPQVVVIFGSFAAAFLIAFISANLAARTQGIILVLIFISLVSVGLGSFAIFGKPGFTTSSQLMGDYPSSGFWEVFAVFFPAVTGILAGVNMSGDLENPRHSIPRGTMSAVILSMLIYGGLAYWFSRVATPQELITNLTIIVDRAAFGPVILVGILAATFSSALTSLVGAPRVLQAIAQHGILPGGERLARTTSRDEPRNALYATGLIAGAGLGFGLLSGGLNAIAPLMTMFFLITYAVLNAVVLLEQTMGLVSFRPRLRVPRLVPLVGLVSCLFVMFLINPIFSLVAVVIILGLYAYLTRRHLIAPWSDVRSGLFVTLAEWAAKRVRQMPSSQERAWKPNLLVPVRSAEDVIGSYRFLKFLTYPRGSVHIMALHPKGEEERIKGIYQLSRTFSSDGIFSLAAVLETDDYAAGLQVGIDVLQSAFFRPNALFMSLDDDVDETLINNVLARVKRQQIGAALYRPHPVVGLGRERSVNVWIREQSPEWEISLRMTSLDLALLLAYQIHRNWHGLIRLVTVVADETEKENAQQFLDSLVDLGRMPAGTQAIVGVGAFRDHLTRVPRADLNIFGLAKSSVTMQFIDDMVEKTHASCLFVQDSGQESALA